MIAICTDFFKSVVSEGLALIFIKSRIMIDNIARSEARGRFLQNLYVRKGGWHVQKALLK